MFHAINDTVRPLDHTKFYKQTTNNYRRHN
uniref:Uncharacterized protein n=1 Tax=Rhizophora mucronata TaxID=61149 RepID=A0A2P2Q6V8_RHIMU